MDADAPMVDTAPGSPCNFCGDNCIVDFIKCGQCAISVHLDCASKWVANKFRNVLTNESQCYGEICEEALGQAAVNFISKGVKCTMCSREKTIDVAKVIAHYAGSHDCKDFFATRHAHAQQLKEACEERASPEVIARLHQEFEAKDFKHAACFLLRLYMYGPSSLSALAHKPEVADALTLQAFRDFFFPLQSDSNLHCCLAEIPLAQPSSWAPSSRPPAMTRASRRAAQTACRSSIPAASAPNARCSPTSPCPGSTCSRRDSR